MTKLGTAGSAAVSERATRLVRGAGRYAGDQAEHGALAAGFVRSTVARGRLSRVDLEAVRCHPGVVAAWSAADLAGEVAPLELRYGPGQSYAWNLLTTGWVSYVGEPLALVVGENRATVEEACELAEVDCEPLDAVTEIAAARSGGTVVRPEIGSNVVFETTSGSGDVEAALAAASVVVERSVHLGRQSPCPLENRAIVASPDPLSGELVVSASTQIPQLLADAVAKVLSRPERSVRVLVPDVGGGFGLKCQVAAEECLVAFAAASLGRPVAWLEDRWENLVASNHAHDEHVRMCVGFSADGAITAVDAEVVVDVGAQSAWPLSFALEPSSVSSHLFGAYAVPSARVRAFGVATNKCPTGAYRGVGASVATFATERLLDEAAAELGFSRVEIRRRNLLGREQMPFTHPIAGEIDSGDPRALFEKALTLAEVRLARVASLHDVFPQPASPPEGALAGSGAAAATLGGETASAAASGLAGVGIAVFFEHTSPGSAVYRRRGVSEVPGFDTARVRFERDGTFSVAISSAESGQDHAAVCRTEVAKTLGVDPRLVAVVEGDTAHCPPGTGTFGSRFAAAQMSAAVSAARAMAVRLREAAAAALGCRREDVVVGEGGFARAGGDAAIGLAQLARTLYEPAGTRPGLLVALPLEELGYWDGRPALSCGAVISAVEVDLETFVSRVTGAVAVQECGRVLDRGAVVGQLRGGFVMGIGDALLEEHTYDRSGEIITSSFLDYLLPSIAESADVDVHLVDDPSLHTARNETGSKGVGESGTVGAVGSIGCAVAAAMRPLGATVDELPATPLRLFRAVAAKADGKGAR